jgi:arsenate reductase (thioredoxin)
MKKTNVLVLCTGNSCRSQMAHGYLEAFAGSHANIYSAGIETHGVNPRAIDVMFEDGVNISRHTSNNVDEYDHVKFDVVLTVCDNAREACPLFLKARRRFHHSFPDPAKATGTEEEIMAEFRRVRDMIKAYCLEFSQIHV